MRNSSACLISVEQEGDTVTIYDNEHYGSYHRRFQTRPEADLCYEQTVAVLQTFRNSLVTLGWEPSDVNEWGYDSD